MHRRSQNSSASNVNGFRFDDRGSILGGGMGFLNNATKQEYHRTAYEGIQCWYGVRRFINVFIKARH